MRYVHQEWSRCNSGGHLSNWIKTKVIPAYTVASVNYCKSLPGKPLVDDCHGFTSLLCFYYQQFCPTMTSIVFNVCLVSSGKQSTLPLYCS